MDIPLNDLGDSEPTIYQNRYYYQSRKYNRIFRWTVIIGLSLLLLFHIFQFYLAFQVMNSKILETIKNLDLDYYQHQVNLIINHINYTLRELDHLNISHYETQIQILMKNANQTLIRINELVTEIKHFLPPN